LSDTIAEDASPSAPRGLADRLKHATQRLHRRAERTGFIHDLLTHRGTLAGYLLFLRNLLPAYEALEAGLEAQAAAGRPLAPLAQPGLYRGAALRADLDHLAGPGWPTQIPVLEAAEAYAGRVRLAGTQGAGAGLAGHAYVRYLGDLNGGQILARLLARDLALPEPGLTFYAFPAFPDPHAAAADFRTAIDGLAAVPGLDLAAIEAEAMASFEASIALSEAVAGCV